MKSLKARFNMVASKSGNERASTFDCFAKAISGQNFSERTLRHWFHKLVDKSEYAKNEKKEIIQNLIEQNKG